MTAELLTSIRELDSRRTDGTPVRLLWCEHDGTLWVTAVNTKTGDAFHAEVHDESGRSKCFTIRTHTPHITASRPPRSSSRTTKRRSPRR